jgi:O-antigen/teichoic acid export membrane protein
MSLPGSQTLKQRVLRAGGWNFAGYGLSQVIRLGSNLIMTRLLAPEMFGVMAIALTVTVILSLLSDIGLRQNIVQSRRGDDPAFLDTAWVFQITRGFVLWLAALGLSMALYLAILEGMLPATSVYSSPVLPLVIAVSSLSAVIAGFRSTKWATAYRRFDQKRIMQIELIAQVAGTVIMIVIGGASHSIWALVAGGLVVVLITTVLSHTWMSGHANSFHWETNAFRELIDFGKWVFVSSFVGVLSSVGDTLLLGSFFQADTLGVYVIAALIVGAVPGGLTRLFAMVSMPALSEIARNNPSRLREVYYKMRLPADLLLLFLMGLLFAAGQLVIDLLYDARYSAAGGIVQVLAASLFASRYGLATQLYLAAGMPRYLTVLNLVQFVALFSVVPALYYLGGAQAAIWGIALHGLAIVPFVFFFNAKLRANDLRRELMVLAAIPVGFACGSALNLLRGW